MDERRMLKNREFLLLIVSLLSVFTLIFSLNSPVNALPQGANITYYSTENASVRPADSHTAAGGSFTTMILNVTSQTSKWKAYIGNVTGRITLDNSNEKTIYDWALTNVQGEVYVSRNNSVNFSSLACANIGNITSEESILNINTSSDDSINSTFRQKVHKSFVIGSTGLIANSTCSSIATFINDSSQSALENATFQEILMSDGKNLVYVTLLENKKAGFDLAAHDFQLIVPDNPTEITNPYYFYAELG